MYSGPVSKVQPLVAPDASKPISGALDPAGSPFWFNGQPSLGLNPFYLSHRGDGKVHKGQKDIDSGGISLGPSKPYKLSASPSRAPTGSYDALHPKVTNTVVVVSPRARRSRAAATVKAQVARQIAKRVAEFKKLSKRQGDRGLASASATTRRTSASTASCPAS